MRKQTNRFGPSQVGRAMGLRRGAEARPVSRNDHIHLFSTEV